MKYSSDTKERVSAAFQLLTGAEISVGSFENARSLLKGIHPEIDKRLELCSKALSTMQKIQSGDVISLSAEHLPEKDEKQKKRKKALLFFIESIKDLKSEIKRVNGELQNSQNASSNQLMSWGRIIKFAKGPLGLVTLAAIVIVIVLPFFTHKTISIQQVPTGTPKITTTKIQVITYQGKELPLSGLYIGHGTDCDSPHYHAVGGKVIATDGTVIIDPEGCGFGKVADTQVTTVSQ